VRLYSEGYFGSGIREIVGRERTLRPGQDRHELVGLLKKGRNPWRTIRQDKPRLAEHPSRRKGKEAKRVRRSAKGPFSATIAREGLLLGKDNVYLEDVLSVPLVLGRRMGIEVNLKILLFPFNKEGRLGNRK